MSQPPVQREGSSRTPVYFLSIGGPNFMENPSHPSYTQLQKVGQEITKQVKPLAIVVFSAHWQGGPNRVLVNGAEQTEIIYDFYGFPPRYYEHKFPNRGSSEIAHEVAEKLRNVGFEVEKVKRGLDHGVWVGFIPAFDPKENPLNVPIVQVSLLGNGDADQHYSMGMALQSLRDQGILIVGAGMAVHNLNDYRRTRGTNATQSYTFTFDEALKEAATKTPEDRREAMSALTQRSGYREAHPTPEHILPMFVAAGAAGDDAGEQLWTLPEGSLSWAQYRFGQVGK